MIPASVDYVRPGSVEEALDALAQPEAKLLAGGQSLLPAMKLRIARPSLLVDVGGLDLGGIEERDGELVVGAITTWDALARADLRPAFRALTECAAGIGDLQVRNLGTIGGSLAHADPASDMPAVTLALGARLKVRSATGERTIDASELALGPFMTSLGEGELITEIRIPVPPEGSGSAYVSVEHPASGFALAGAAAQVYPDRESRVALTGVVAAPFLLIGDDGADEAEMFGDRFAPIAYRRQLAETVVRRAIALAEDRAKEDS
ncbi:MAG TPA: xanthine dehydrogenase family protein subunit M [Gaiellaceae bacterium]|nr:xanthine dehydrogenase family protein subunit M [Gaiellaceae bacterium]